MTGLLLPEEIPPTTKVKIKRQNNEELAILIGDFGKGQM